MMLILRCMGVFLFCEWYFEPDEIGDRFFLNVFFRFSSKGQKE